MTPRGGPTPLQNAPLPTDRLTRLWVASALLGIGAVPFVLWLFGALFNFEPFPTVIAAAWGSLVFGGTFFIGTNLIGVTFEERVTDETRVSGASVDHITHVEPYDDAARDRWLSRYVFARNLFGALIVPLAIFVGLFVFA
ncbi:MAG: hypothetical protein AAGJ32_06495 [Pseudomonadota bacterium]